jgi:hypothetical protein
MVARRGTILMELIVAVGLLALVVTAFAVAQATDQQWLRAQYYRAVAMEIVDGEMEALVAGEWKACGEGSHEYAVRADAARNLPDGRFVLTVKGGRVRLEWIPAQLRKGGRVVREASVR